MKNENKSAKFAVISKNVLNLYASPDTNSEMVSQAILGQPAWIESEDNGWVRIRTWDNYPGWTHAHWVLQRDENRQKGRTVLVRSLFSDILTEPHESSDIITKIVITSEIDLNDVSDSWVNVSLPDGRSGYIRRNEVQIIDPSIVEHPAAPFGEALVRTAKRFVGIPYRWGASTPFGIDCSGLMQLVHHIHGVTIPRDASMQAADPRARPVERGDWVAGDLVFFTNDNEPDKIFHVGMAIGDGNFIHASGGNGGVIVTPHDDPYYTQIYWGAMRLV